MSPRVQEFKGRRQERKGHECAVRCVALRCVAVRCGAVRCGAVWCVAHTHTRAHARSPRISNAEFKGRRKEATVRCGAHTHTDARSLT